MKVPRLVSIDQKYNEKLSEESNASAIINNLLEQYYGESEETMAKKRLKLKEMKINMRILKQELLNFELKKQDKEKKYREMIRQAGPATIFYGEMAELRKKMRLEGENV